MKKLNLNKGDKAYLIVWNFKARGYVVIGCTVKAKRVTKTGCVTHWVNRDDGRDIEATFDECGYRNFKSFRERMLCFNPSRLFDCKADAEAVCKLAKEV